MILRKLLVILLVVSLPGANLCAQENDKKIKLLVIIGRSPSPGIEQLTEEDRKRSGFSALLRGDFLTADAWKKRNKKYSEQLAKTIGDFPRAPLYKENLAKEFARQGRPIELKILDWEEAYQRYGDISATDKRNVDIQAMDVVEHLGMDVDLGKALEKDGWPYALFLYETADYVTPSDIRDKLVLRTRVSAHLFWNSITAELFNEMPSTIYPVPIDLERALNDREFFTTNLEKPLRQLCFNLYQRLNGTDVLHKMALHFGIQDKFPSVAELFKRYAKQFRFKQSLPKGWKKVDSNNDFIFIAAPKEDELTVAVVADVDLLIEPLGQNYQDLKDYYNLRYSRLQNMGWDLSSMVEPPKMELTEDWDSFSLAEPRGGKAIFLHRKVGEEFMLTHQVVLLGDKREEQFKRYKGEIESYINNSLLKVK